MSDSDDEPEHKAEEKKEKRHIDRHPHKEPAKPKLMSLDELKSQRMTGRKTIEKFF